MIKFLHLLKEKCSDDIESHERKLLKTIVSDSKLVPLLFSRVMKAAAA